MSILDDLATELAAAGVGAYDPVNPLPDDQTPITLGAMPPEGVAAVVLTMYPGPEPDSRGGDEYPRLQVRVRGADALEAHDLDRLAYDALHFTADGPNRPRVVGDHWLQDCHAMQSYPQPLGIDANGRHEYVRNYQLTCRPT